MQLKRLELVGFKSFADKTEIGFEDGITAVVGPNGSGKSNISDALRWVLGEQSAKTLRGNKMGDVIFAGTQSRKPVGYCQVSLVFDNSDNWLDIEYKEVVIARRYYKSGESEYYINKTICRLKDILELFRDTGVGKEGYSIIGQGQITDIVSGNNNDRRMVFEAATGIVKYKTRRLEAQNRLIKTKENMDRLNDILNEVSINLETLEEQSKVAKEYIRIRDELKQNEVSYFAKKCNEIDIKINEFNNELNIICENIRDDEKNVNKFSLDIIDIDNKYKELNLDLNLSVDKYAKIREENVKTEAELKLLSQKIESLKENILRLQEENNYNEIQIIESKNILDKYELELNNINISKDKTNIEFNTAEFEMQNLKKDLSKKQEKLETLKQENIKYLNSVSKVKIDKSKYLAMMESIKSRMDSIQMQKCEFEKKINQLNIEKDNIENLIENNNNYINSLEIEKDNIQQDYIKNNDDVIVMQEDIHKLDMNISGLKSKYLLLKNMEKEYEGYQYSVKNLLKFCDGKQEYSNMILGSVAENLKVSSEFSLAIETALGNTLQNIITNNEQDAKKLINVLKENKIGRATFLPISTIKPSKLNDEELRIINSCQGIIGIACDLVEYDEKFDNIIRKLLGRVVVSKNIDSAIEVMKKANFKFITVTLNGEIMYAGGAMSGGSKGKAGILSKRDEIVSVQKILDEKELLLKDFKFKINDLKLQSLTKTDELNKVKNIILEKQSYINELNNQKSIIKNQIENENTNIINLNEEISMLDDNFNDVNQKIITIDDENNDQVIKVEEDIIIEITKEITIINNEIEKKYDNITNLSIEKANIIKDIARIENDRNRILKEISKLENQLNNNKNTVILMNQSLNELEKKIIDINVNDEIIELRNKEYNTLIDKIKTEIFECEKSKQNIQKNIDEKNQIIKQNTDRKYKLQVEIEKRQIEEDLLKQEIFEKYDITLEDITENTNEFSIAQLNRNIADLKNKIKSIGNVNLNAIDEYASTHLRHAQLTTQLEDLETSKKDLEDLIEMLYENMTKQFNEQFKLINENFQRIFKNLFGGGTSSLLLKDSHNILESEIEIIAQPPGKKLQSLSLLSGGEKALTAIAILFAMLELKPTPFCVLDEIEAALDEANVYSFAKYLMNYSNNTQFIVITHRRGVMDNCDAIYGITMQEKGVSKVVSIKTKGVN